MPTVIVHAATRVVRRLTSEASPALAADETAIDLSGPIDIGKGPWKLDSSNTLVPASTAEAQAAGIDETYEQARRQAKLDNLRTALDDALANELMPARLRAVMQRFRELLG